ncbi:MAG: DUF2863 family protein [Usitatibacteraceae bacterium]
MKRVRSKSPRRLTRDAERLITLSTGLSVSGSRAEDRVWEAEIAALVVKAMETANDPMLETALDHTFKSNPVAHDVLAELIETSAESTQLTVDGNTWDVLLLALPMVAWSRYVIPSGPVPEEIADTVVTHLGAHVLAGDARASISPYLYSIDQMPRDFSHVRKMTIKLGEAAITQVRPRFDFAKAPETAPLPADSRFLLAAVAVPQGAPLFRWQEKDQKSTRTDCLERWVAQGRPNLARLLPGTAFECCLPDAYFHNCRESDRRVRPYAVRAAVGFLEDTLKTNAGHLRAIIANVGEENVDEYRIAFTQRGQDDVLHGVVWPLFGREDDEQTEAGKPTPREEIEAIFKECKVGEVVKHSELFAPEFCEDCGAPLFVDADKEMVHAELPEEADSPPAHYH